MLLPYVSGAFTNLIKVCSLHIWTKEICSLHFNAGMYIGRIGILNKFQFFLQYLFIYLFIYSVQVAQRVFNDSCHL